MSLPFLFLSLRTTGRANHFLHSVLPYEEQIFTDLKKGICAAGVLQMLRQFVESASLSQAGESGSGRELIVATVYLCLVINWTERKVTFFIYR